MTTVLEAWFKLDRILMERGLDRSAIDQIDVHESEEKGWSYANVWLKHAPMDQDLIVLNFIGEPDGIAKAILTPSRVRSDA
jgi:hypothetical protein